jgi:hypothetical protein
MYRRLAVLLTLFVGAGCFAAQPVSTGAVPEVGSRLDVTLNDAGRVTLGPAIGSGVERIEGVLLEKDSSGMSLSVKHIFLLNGSVQIWSDELIRVEDSQVLTLSLRRFSAARTAVLGAAGIGGFALMVASGLNPFGLGDEEPGGGKSDTAEAIIRVIRP